MILATSLFHLQLASVLVAIDYNVLIEYVFYMVYMLAVLGIIATLYIHKKEKDISEAQGSLEKIKAAKKTESAGEGEEAKALDKENNQLQESISNDQLLIKRIVLTGQVGYPLVIIVTIIVITQSKWLPYLQKI